MENVVEVRSIEVRYAGVVVGRSTKVRDWGDAGAFIGFAEPLPSGTSLLLKGDGIEQPARVIEVIESADPAVAGMQVKFVGAAEVARPAPKPAPARAEAAASVPAPVAEAAPAVPAPVAEPAHAEASESTSSAASNESSGAEVEGDGQGGQNGQPGSGGKRRRRRR